ncbi:fungal-specific transcription factor domain-containing protein [Exophiala viscosa]|uniref:fungal-specific transcription factor domain-containing protein n=1 Tax=Exophiala viscosa TaxID=2486360 RepID=UPI002190754B|nr:fungal-specific transcription factor domain-containing protein [Exophiala viscosa]
MYHRPVQEEQTPPRRRFQIHSEFGIARQRRSRKARPCDVCRKRKTACVINDRPPCVFCKSRGLTCQSTLGPRRLHNFPSPGVGDYEQDGSGGHSLAATTNTPGEHVLSVEGVPESPLVADQSIGTPSLDSIRTNDTRRGPTDNGVVSPVGTATVRSDSKVYTLEDGIDVTARSMGIAAEQDPHLLAFFRAIIIDEQDRVHSNVVQVSLGDASTGAVPIHFTLLQNDFQSHDNQIRYEASDEIESKVGPYGPNLVKLYFKHIHSVYCVISKTRFLRAYRTDKTSIPASLRGVVYGLASVFWNDDSLLRTVPQPFEQYELFLAARASLERELDAPNLWKMQACLLIIHEATPSYWSHETPRAWTLSAQAVACAQEIGLHRDPSDWKIAPWEKSLRKKLWWATYMTDIWSSITNGNPSHIHSSSYTTSNLDMADLEFDEDVPEDLQDMVHPTNRRFDIATAARFWEHIKLTQLTHRLLETALTDQSVKIPMLEQAQQESRLLRIQRELKAWYNMLPQCLTMHYSTRDCRVAHNGRIHLGYHATQILLLRALMAPATEEAKHNPASSLRRYFEAAVEEATSFSDFVHGITHEDVEAFWGCRESKSEEGPWLTWKHPSSMLTGTPVHLDSRGQLVLAGSFTIYLFFLSSGPQEVQTTYKRLENFQGSLLRIASFAGEPAKGLFWPITLRIDCFFKHAAQIMREGTVANYSALGRMVDVSP